jgi:hypothetical protein
MRPGKVVYFQLKTFEQKHLLVKKPEMQKQFQFQKKKFFLHQIKNEKKS